jgi:hypothetical protein
MTPYSILDSAGRVSVDLPCVNCQYNLRTLAIDGLCSECGTPALYTLHSRHIQFSPLTWLRTLIRGCFLIIAAPGVPVLIGFMLMPLPASRQASLEVPLLIIPALALLAVGVWMITRPDPLIRKYTQRREPIRRLLAMVTIGWTVSIALALCLPDSVRSRVTGLEGAELALNAIGGPVLLLLLTRHLWNLVRRGASRGILITYQITFWLAAALSVLGVTALLDEHGLSLMRPAWIELGCLFLLPTSLIATFMHLILTASIVAVARQRAVCSQGNGRKTLEIN